MEIYLKGYYGYKNIGDELLLLGVINWIAAKHNFSTLKIEAKHPLWLTSWISRHTDLLNVGLEQIICCDKSWSIPSSSLKIFGGGEVMTDARPIPYNGRNYLVKYFFDILLGNYAILGGIGVPKKIGSKLLYTILLGNAQYIVTREAQSTKRAEKYSSSVIPYHDFSETILAELPAPDQIRDKLLININPYIATPENIQKIVTIRQENPDLLPYFIPGDIGEDMHYYYLLKEKIPDLELYDWTKCGLRETIKFFASGAKGIAARLHILFLLHHCDVPFEPLIYQEKITKFFGDEIVEKSR